MLQDFEVNNILNASRYGPQSNDIVAAYLTSNRTYGDAKKMVDALNAMFLELREEYDGGESFLAEWSCVQGAEPCLCSP